MIKAIIFDIGGILDKGDFDEHWKVLCSVLGIELDKFQKSRVKYSDDARTGKISTQEHVSRIAKDIGVKYDDLLREWLRTKRENMQIDTEIEMLIKQLKKTGYKVGTVSNITEIHHRIRLEKNAYALFDFIIVSFKEGFSKPDHEIFKSVPRKAKASFGEIIFIDDYEPNLKAAEKLGMKIVLFKNNKQLIQDLKKLGVKI